MSRKQGEILQSVTCQTADLGIAKSDPDRPYSFLGNHKKVSTCTQQPLYNTVCYNRVLDTTPFKDGSQKCIDYMEK